MLIPLETNNQQFYSYIEIKIPDIKPYSVCLKSLTLAINYNACVNELNHAKDKLTLYGTFYWEYSEICQLEILFYITI